MLDNANVISQRDPQGALGVAEGEWEQLVHDFGVTLTPSGQVDNVVLSGMGGSALPGVILPVWPGVNKPFEISRNYDIPNYVNDNTLYIASSYSGNTEETLESLEKALAKGAQVVVVSAGGKLAEKAKENNLPLFTIPGGIQPRMCTFFFLKAFSDILSQYGLAQAGLDELKAASEWLKEESARWGATVTPGENLAKLIAEKLVGKIVIVYGGPKMFPAANKWKICMNENAKNLAWSNQYPELNHNEFIGWSSHPVDKPTAVVEIRSNQEHERVQKRFEVTERLLSGMRPAPIVVTPQGDTVLRQLLWSINLGDCVSVYLAILNGVNPTPVDLVEKLKVELG